MREQRTRNFFPVLIQFRKREQLKMAQYSAVALDHFSTPRNFGPLDDYDYEGHAVLSGQSPYLRLHLRVADGRIERATFMTFGCAAAIACGSMLTELISGTTIADCRAITVASLDHALDGIPEERRFCLELAISALRNALTQIDADSQAAVGG